MRKSALRLVLVLSAVLANAQMGIVSPISMSFRGQGDAQGNQWGTLMIELRPPVPPALIGAPFTGKQEMQAEQLLPDGGRITQPVPSGTQFARDAQGRTRVERALGGAMLAAGRTVPAPVLMVEINDVVDGSYYVLDSAKKIAYRIKYTPVQPRTVPLARPPAPSAPQGALIPGGGVQPQTAVEPLGTKFIQGVQAEGQRRTTVWPVGSRGNDRPMTDVNETWTAPSLQMVLVQRSQNATNKTTMEIANLSTLNPPLDLFRPPAGYEVHDEPGSFTVEFGNKPANAVPISNFSGAGGAVMPPPQR